MYIYACARAYESLAACHAFMCMCIYACMNMCDYVNTHMCAHMYEYSKICIYMHICKKNEYMYI